MSPVSRPAYIKTFGKTTTEAAEAKAREIIAEKEAARQRTKYAQHAQEADRLEGVPAVGGFFWADNSGLKCDGGRGLFEELHALTCYTHAAEKPARLCCVEQIIKVSEEDFARPELADELAQKIFAALGEAEKNARPKLRAVKKEETPSTEALAAEADFDDSLPDEEFSIEEDI